MSTPSKAKTNESQGDSIQFTSWSAAEQLFRKQKAYFDTDATKTYEWRIDQLDRLTRMLKENYERFADASCRDFKTATQENVFEVSASIATTRIRKVSAQGVDETGRSSASQSSSPHPGTKEWCTASLTASR